MHLMPRLFKLTETTLRTFPTVMNQRCLVCTRMPTLLSRYLSTHLLYCMHPKLKNVRLQVVSFTSTSPHCKCSTLQTQETHTLVNTVLDVQPRLASSGGGKTNDEIVYELADNILAKIPEKLDIDKALPELFEVGIHTYMCHGLLETNYFSCTF